MMTCKDVEQSLRNEMQLMSLKTLREFASGMGVEVDASLSREELEDECVFLEVYAFTH